jgi:hypothetical protein
VREPLRSRARIFLDTHPALGAALRHSGVWPQIRTEAKIHVADEDLYIVAGDTLGDEEELFLDRLARGARPSADPLSRALFLELPESLQTLVRHELLLERPPAGGHD